MTSKSLEKLSVDALVEQFISMALAQDTALLHDETAKYNRLFDKMEHVKEQLKGRGDDERRALLPFLQHSNPHVRLKAAIALLALEPQAARAALQKIWEAKEFPQAADALGMLRAIDQGRYVPT
jgi:hypothetical protein